MVDILIIVILIFLLLYYLYFLYGILTGLGKLNTVSNKKDLNEFVSVIIPFRNESRNILGSLSSLRSQTYPKEKFEVIYVNDNSEDDSFEKLNLAIKDENIKVVSVPDSYETKAHKKRAIKYGIEKSKGEIIVTTDADCFHSKNWLIQLLSCFNEKTGFVSGPVEFVDHNSFFGNLQKIEFAGLVLAGAGLIGIKKPAICNAANIAYRKKAFDEVKGFDGQLKLSSGDDELLMQKISKNGNYKVEFCMNQDAIVRTEANDSLGNFYQQRKRWASKGLFYADKVLILKLLLIFLFYLGLIAEIVLGLTYSSEFLYLFVLSFLLKVIFEYLILNKGKKKLFTRLRLGYFSIAEILHIPYIIISGISGALGNFVWKDRKVKR